MYSPDQKAAWPPEMPAREQVSPEEVEAYDSVVDRQTAYGYAEFVKRFRHDEMLAPFPGDRVQPYFGAMLNSPLVARGMSDLGAIYRSAGEREGGMSHTDREWADMVVSAQLGIWWVLYVHAPDAAAVGVRPDAILAIIRGDDDALEPDEREVAGFYRAVIDGTMDAARYGRTESRVGIKAAVEMAAFAAHLLKTSRLMQTWGVPNVSREVAEEFVQAIAAGEVELPAGPRVSTKS